MNGGRSVSAVAARWAARALSAALLLFWGFFLAAHVLGDAGDPSRSLTWGDYVIVGAMLVSLVGLAVAWRWEAAGAITALLGVVVGAAINWKVLISPEHSFRLPPSCSSHHGGSIGRGTKAM